MSFWEKHEIGQKAIDILRDAHEDREGRHFGRAFLTAYQVVTWQLRRRGGLRVIHACF